ncbi:MAPEG family protein [Aminobacter sp. UC22_36]|uniref:MAPEG family protein n=1 Tax=Aminobacter sp. UC22_36 TaxID=3374549 RepID=UPI00375633E2
MLPITSTTAALAAVALVVLSITVSLHRKKVGVRIGYGEDIALMRRIRAQGNFIEYVPLALILLALAEYRQASAAMLWTIAGLLVVGRCLHIAGILTGRTPLSAPGMVGTYGALLAGAAALMFG